MKRILFVLVVVVWVSIFFNYYVMAAESEVGT